MTRQRIGVFLLIFVLLLASCTGDPLPNTFDWCYVFDFTTSDYGSNLVSGSWVPGSGFTTDVSSGNLEFVYTYAGGTVHPTAGAIITAARGAGITEEIQVQDGLARIFGIGGISGQSFSTTIPDGYQVGDFNVAAGSSTAAGNLLSIRLHASQKIHIRAIEVRGYGASPFPAVNPCANPATLTAAPSATPLTHTPAPTVEIPPTSTGTQPPTATPSNTPLPPTVTYTPSITSTPLLCEWEQDIDFSASMGGFAINTDVGPGAAEYGSGVGWKEVHVVTGGGNTDVLYIRAAASYSSVVTSIEVWLGGNFGNGYAITSNVHSSGGYLITGQVIAGYAHTEGVSFSIAAGQYFSFGHFNSTTSGDGGYTYPDGYISRVRYRGTGNNPFTGETCTLPTSTPTYTPSASATPSNTPLPSATATASPNPSQTRTVIPLNTNTPRFTPRPPTLTRTPSPIPPSVTASYTPLPPSATRTLIPSPTGFGGRTPTPCGITPTPGGLTPTPEIPLEPGIAEETADFYTFVIQFINWLVNTIGSFFDYIGSIFSWFGSALNNIATQLSNLIALIVALLDLLLRYINDLLTILRMLMEIMLRIVQLAFAWLMQVIDIAVGDPTASRAAADDLPRGILLVWYVTPAEAIPGLPQCASNPMVSDICAFYYVVQYTILSGFVGGLIVPAIMTILDVTLIIYFLRRARGLLNKLKDLQV